MSRAVELILEVDDGEGHAENVDRVASPGEPSVNKGIGSGDQSSSSLDSDRHSCLPREKETPLGEGEAPQDVEERSRVLRFLSPRDKVSDEVRGHEEWRVGGERKSKRAPRGNRSLLKSLTIRTGRGQKGERNCSGR